MAKKKPAPEKKPAKPKATKAKPAPKPIPAPPPADASAALVQLGFFRGAHNWEADREVPCLGERVRLLVDHTGGVVAPAQVRALELLLETETPLRPVVLHAAYECMLRWVENFRNRHPDFKGKPIAERAFSKGCELGTVFFRAPKTSAEKPAPGVIVNVYWSADDGHPYEVTFEWQRGAWVVVASQRS
jgi:hypothetical protein